MIAVWFVAVLLALCALAFLHAVPLLPTGARLFGVRVAPGIRNGPEGARLLRRYQLSLLPFTAAAALIVIVSPLRVLWIVAAIAAAALASVGLAIRYHAAALQFALPPPSTREASLTADTGGVARRLLWFAPPFGLLGIIAIYLAANWNRIPETFPIHFGAHGQPNGWSHRTAHGVFGPVIFGAYFVVGLTSLYAIMDVGGRRSHARSVMLTALAAPSYMIAVMFSLASLVPLLHPPAWLFILLAGGFLPVFLILLARVLAQPSDGPREITPDRCWHGNFYYNPGDPALFVEARIGFGFTMNFAHRPAWLLIALTLAFTLGAFLLAPRILP